LIGSQGDRGSRTISVHKDTEAGQELIVQANV
jgi:hypothetical protein